MTQKAAPSVLERGANVAGRLAGKWRHRQNARTQDAFVEMWKRAWAQGCEAAWAGRDVAAPARMNEPQRDAWAAGWTWAQTQPDRRRQTLRDGRQIGGRRSTDLPRPLVRAAKGGAAGLIVFATARWLMGMRRTAAKITSASARPPE